MVIKIRNFIIPLLILIFLSNSGCMKLALRMSPELFQNISGSIFEECDPDLAQKAIPANLKLLEGILKNDPDNVEILRLLSMGFCGYSILFVENKDKARASNLYYRATSYGLKAIGFNVDAEKISREELENALKNLDKNNYSSLLWVAVSWSSYININIDKPAVIAQLGLAQLCIDTLTKNEPDLFYGLPYLLKAVSLSARSPMLGGDYKSAKEYYEKALLSGNRKLMLTQFFYARYYCIGIQDKAMFVSFLKEIIDENSESPSDLCLINQVIRARSESLLDNVDDYFL